ncbi:DNA-binding response regulator [Spirochaetia bacterium]|nr:DNA-binding response regulator [Spirochaetia bacterium]GHU34437.1 DNA-binding response regulator [Spirochaetia bacterium]
MANEQVTKSRILIIEDDDTIAELERDFLEINGFETARESDGLKGMERALKDTFDLILLDLMLPGIDGFGICRSIRDKINVPILMVTARGEETDKVRGLGLGADDYITKNFTPAELVARIKSHIARFKRITETARQTTTIEKREAAEKEIILSDIVAGNIVINPSTRRVFVSGTEIELANKEYELLFFLASNPEIVFSKEKLYDKIWGEDMYGDINTVREHITRLRKKIERDPSNPVHIQTVWGAGYRFCG